MAIQFTYRAAAVIVTETRVLLHRCVRDAFWSLPGGHVELGETAAHTLRREMLEEIGHPVEVGRLLWVAENLFTHNGRNFHELGLYFAASFAGDSPLYQTERFMGVEAFEPELGGDLRLEFRWFERRAEVLRALPVLPQFLQTGLVSLPPHPVHTVQVEG